MFMKLLIVDDSQPMRAELKHFLGDLAEEIAECDDGSQALAVYAEQQPDWVLMDIMMKEVDGLTATRQLKTSFPDARIMIVTGYDDVDLRVAAQSAGACGYVTKDNLQEVRRILGEGQAATQH
jgi:CheY-like chemotaxis protein